jgi:hypothetical protein
MYVYFVQNLQLAVIITAATDTPFTACYQNFQLYETRAELDPRLGFSHVSAFVGHRCRHGGFIAFPLCSSQSFALSSTPAETMAYPP